MKKPYYIIALIIAGLTLAGAGCGKKAAEKTAEDIIESSTNGQADVDIDDSSVSVNTNGASWAAGESVSLPADFPSDIYVIDGTIKSAVKVDENNGFNVSIEINESVDSARAIYERELVSDGWTIASTIAADPGVTFGATKNNRTTTVGIYDYENNGQVMVVITTSDNE